MNKWLAVALLALAGPAFAQMTPAELAEKGKKLSKDEVQALMSGAGFSYTTPAGFPVNLIHDKTGGITGNVVASQGSFMLTGTWTVNDAGKYCNKWTGPRGGSSSCYDVYRLGDKPFFVTEQGKAFPPNLTH